METDINELKSMTGEESDERVDELINKLIATKDDKSEQIMTECSHKAKEIKDEINGILETRRSLVTNVGQVSEEEKSAIDSDSILNLQKELEMEISGMNHSSKLVSNNDKTNKIVFNTNNSIINTKVNDIDSEDNNKLLINENQTNVCNDSESIDKNINSDNNNILTVEQSSASDVITAEQSSGSDNTTVEQSSASDAITVEQSSASDAIKTDPNLSNSNKNNSSRKQTKSVSKKVDHKERLTIEQLNKKLSVFKSDSERITYLSNCFVEMSEQNRNLIQQNKQNDRINHQLSKEKDQMQGEHNRLVLAKSRLESLCRELQRQNKLVKEESILKIKEEEEKRRDIANKFQGTLNEIMQLIQENQKRNTQLKEENADLAQKLKTLMGHYESWEKHTEKIIKQKELETQLVKAKYSKTNLILNQEKEIFFKEKQQLIQMIGDLQKRCTELATSELKVRTELGVYTNKYEEFQGVLTKSNDMFAGFKRDMERMSKQIKRLENETILWKNRWESSNKALLELSEQKQKRDTEHLTALQKIITLEKLCRAMQTERALMLEKLKIDSEVNEVNGENVNNENQVNGENVNNENQVNGENVNNENQVNNENVNHENDKENEVNGDKTDDVSN